MIKYFTKVLSIDLCEMHILIICFSLAAVYKNITNKTFHLRKENEWAESSAKVSLTRYDSRGKNTVFNSTYCSLKNPILFLMSSTRQSFVELSLFIPPLSIPISITWNRRISSLSYCKHKSDCQLSLLFSVWSLRWWMNTERDRQWSNSSPVAIRMRLIKLAW